MILTKIHISWHNRNYSVSGSKTPPNAPGECVLSAARGGKGLQRSRRSAGLGVGPLRACRCPGMGKLPGDSGEGPLLSDGPSPRNMRFTANQAGFHGEGVGVEMRPSPEEGDARSEPGRTGKNRQDGKDWADGVGLGSVSPGSGVADKRKKTAFLLSFSCTPNRSNIELFSGRSGANLGTPGRYSGAK